MTVITKEGWEYTVPKETEFSLGNVKQVLLMILVGLCTCNISWFVILFRKSDWNDFGDDCAKNIL